MSYKSENVLCIYVKYKRFDLLFYKNNPKGNYIQVLLVSENQGLMLCFRKGQ